MTGSPDWPALEIDSWAPTKTCLHRCAQMLGKLRLALAPHQPNFLFTSLALTARGCTTGAIPVGLRSLQASLDVFAAQIVIETSEGARQRIELAAQPTIAALFAAFTAALSACGIEADLSPIPQEMADLTPFDRDDRPMRFEAADAQRWLTVMSSTNAVFDRWRAHFFGRTGIALWWGALDFALLLFSGKHVDAPRDRGYLIKYDLDAEMLNVGFYPGDDANPAMFYGYIYPQPPACSTLTVVPQASWSDKLGEWVLPYADVRAAADPAAVLSGFLDGMYGLCGAAAGWQHDAYRYVPPPLRRAPPARRPAP